MCNQQRSCEVTHRDQRVVLGQQRAHVARGPVLVALAIPLSDGLITCSTKQLCHVSWRFLHSLFQILQGAFQMLVSVRGLQSLFALKSPRLIWMCASASWSPYTALHLMR